MSRDTEDLPLIGETPSRPPAHGPSLAILSLVNLLMNVDTTVILPTLWYYLLSKDPHVSTSYLGWILAVFSIGGFISAPLLGWFADAVSMKIGLVFSLIILAGGNVMYALAPNNSAILIARLIAGLAAGNIVLGFTYISTAVSSEKRTAQMGMYRGIGLLGMIAAPGLSAVMLKLDVNSGGFVLNQYTAPGYIIAIVAVLFIPFIIFFFKDLPNKRQRNKRKGPQDELEKPKSPYAQVPREVWPRLIFFLFLSMWQYFVISAFNSTTAPVTQEAFNWPPFYVAMLYLVMGFMVLISTAIVSLVSKKLSDITLISVGSFLLVIGLICCGDYKLNKEGEEVMFSISALGAVMGLSAGMTTVPSIFSKWIANVEEKGGIMSLIPIAGGVGRILGPIFAGYALDSGNRNIVFLIQAGLTLILMLMSLVGKKYFIPNPNIIFHNPPVSSVN